MYQVLYRKYRPQTFSDVVGQTHITKTLANEVEQNKLSHAYLFTGTRGTGKTTCAKILAKAVNCKNPINGDPCNECDICRGIDDGSILDVLEIDAASNNGVDNIRDIRDESNFSPVSCKFRVYIIDEVHMLSIGAFNALLKTLEEPPAHVKFILATTEVHKLPVTIISRCQRFDFKKVNAQDLIGRMQYIAQKEEFTLEDDAATLIARLADGGVRDALSLLDQCCGISDVVSDKVVTQVAGLTGKAHLFELATLASSNDTSAVLELISELYANSIDMEHLCSDLINHYRNLMIVKTVKSSENLLVCTKEELAEYINQANTVTLESILLNIDLFSQTLSNIKRGANRRIEIEMAFIKASNPQASSDISAILKRLAALETAVRTGSVSNVVPQNPEKVAPTQVVPERKVEDKPKVSQNQETPQAVSAPKVVAPQTQAATTGRQSINWTAVIDQIKSINMGMYGVLVGSSAYIEGDFVFVHSTNSAFQDFIRAGSNGRDVKEAIFRATGQKYRLAIAKDKSAEPTVSETQENSVSSLDSLLEKAMGLGINVDQND